ncbi:MAG: hypothetical protein AAF394_05380 [Planctomycetota bacterium]
MLALKLPNSSIGKPREEKESGGKGLAGKVDWLHFEGKLYFITPRLENQAGLHLIQGKSYFRDGPTLDFSRFGVSRGC